MPNDLSPVIVRVVIEPWQFRAARAALDLTRNELADASGLSLVALSNAESDRFDSRGRTLAKLQAFYESRGIVFLDQNSGGPGIVRRPQS